VVESFSQVGGKVFAKSKVLFVAKGLPTQSPLDSGELDDGGLF
jgi:hypothetical protein